MRTAVAFLPTLPEGTDVTTMTSVAKPGSSATENGDVLSVRGEAHRQGNVVAPLVVGLDLSLTSTGIATNSTPGHNTYRIRTTGHKTDTTIDRSRRLIHIRNLTLGCCRDAALVVIEGPSYSSQSGSQHDRSGLWWLIVTRLVTNNIPVAVVPPANRMKYATGKGGGPNSGKDAVLAAVVKRYPEFDVTHNDIADAVVLLAMGLHHLGAPLAVVPDTHRKALDAVAWPELIADV